MLMRMPFLIYVRIKLPHEQFRRCPIPEQVKDGAYVVGSGSDSGRRSCCCSECRTACSAVGNDRDCMRNIGLVDACEDGEEEEATERVADCDWREDEDFLMVLLITRRCDAGEGGEEVEDGEDDSVVIADRDDLDFSFSRSEEEDDDVPEATLRVGRISERSMSSFWRRHCQTKNTQHEGRQKVKA